jgi:hypothetical protein
MGLSFHHEPASVEAVGSLKFEAADPSIEERRDDDTGGGDNIQIVDR